VTIFTYFVTAFSFRAIILQSVLSFIICLLDRINLFAGLIHAGNSRPLIKSSSDTTGHDYLHVVDLCFSPEDVGFSRQCQCHSFSFFRFTAVLCQHVLLFTCILIMWIFSHQKPCSSHVRSDSYWEFRARQVYVRFAFRRNWQVLGFQTAVSMAFIMYHL
jgi:hypothetical protein